MSVSVAAMPAPTEAATTMLANFAVAATNRCPMDLSSSYPLRYDMLIS